MLQFWAGKAYVSISDEDADLIGKYYWNPVGRNGTIEGYVIGSKPRVTFYLHVIIGERMGLKGEMTDHKDRDVNNCQRTNLREATAFQNGQNSGKRRKTPTSKYKGVHWNTQNNIWIASIRVNGVAIHLGCFYIEEEAALAYDRAAIKHFDEYACLNFPEET